MGTFYWVWTGFWVLFYLTHSALATKQVKDWSRKQFPSLHEHYRIIYNTFNAVVFVGLWIYASYFSSYYILSPHSLIWIAALGFLIFGAVVGLATFRTFDGGEFLLGKQTSEPQQLIETGWYGRVRHPLYFALLLLLLGGLLMWPTAKMTLFVLISCVYLPFGMYWEEQKLLQVFGSRYKAYMRRTPQIIPYLWK